VAKNLLAQAKHIIATSSNNFNDHDEEDSMSDWCDEWLNKLEQLK
jgi:hypothetical protein